MTLLGRLIVAAIALVFSSTPLFAECQLGQMLELKVTMAGMQPLVPATINGHDVMFVADSGAFYSNISPGNAAELGLDLTASSLHTRGIGGETTTSFTTVKSFVLAGVAVPHIVFLVGGSEIGRNGGIGLLGQNVLGIGDVEYDLEDGAIRLMKAKDCANVNLAYWSGKKPVSILATGVRDIRNPHTIGSILINGVKIRAMFDTGAESSMLSLDAAARLGIKPSSPGVKPVGFSHGVGRRVVQTWSAPIASIKIGDQEEIKNVHIEIGEMDLDDADMLIGADFFLSHRVYVANSLHKIYLTYDGGPVFNTTPARVISADGAVQTMPTDDNAAPTDAEGYSRRGAAFASRKQYDLAIADFSKAIELAPADARYPYQRAMVRLAKKRIFPALADLDQTLKLDPGNVDAHLTRAALRIEVPDKAEAKEDIDDAEKLIATQSDKRLEIGSLYDQVDAFDAAVAEFDLWIKAHPDDSKRAQAFNDRCWARAQAGRDLGKALEDCNMSLHLQPKDASVLDSRGLVHLRMGNLGKAVADYDAGLAIAPKMAWSLYGRGIAELRQGLKEKGETDLKASAAVDPKLSDRAKALGVAP